MMTRITKAFAKPAFVAYLTAGNPSLAQSIHYAKALIDAGVDVLEIGIPFSDPVADGPVIQQAMQQALKQQTTLTDVLALVTEVRRTSDVAIILFSYYNPILAAGKDFYQQAKQAGVDGVLIVDLPLEEQAQHLAQCREHQLDCIQIISSVSCPERIQAISQQASGFIYYACQKGTTGGAKALPDDYGEQISAIRQATALPIATGFGIADASVAKTVLTQANGFVVGSHLVAAMNRDCSANELADLAQQLDPR